MVLTCLVVRACAVTSLQPLSQLGDKLQRLVITNCSEVQEVVLQLPHVQTSAQVQIYDSGVREVVLAGGVSRAVGFSWD
jgi:hypothetical protein